MMATYHEDSDQARLSEVTRPAGLPQRKGNDMGAAVSLARDAVNRGLRPLGVQVVRRTSSAEGAKWFIAARPTIAAARRSGLSVGDYIDRTFAQPGATVAAIDAIVAMAGLSGPLERVCEIGPGTGRYLQATIERLSPHEYEIYETAQDWVRYLSKFPTVIPRPCDGSSLSATTSDSVDLVQAHKVMVYLEFWTVVGYLDEMARVVRPGGVVAFDVITEGCLRDDVVARWRQERSVFRPLPGQWVIDYLGRRGLAFLGSSRAPLPFGDSELLVFKRGG
jgi:SAM-dependent methyltransferase